MFRWIGLPSSWSIALRGPACSHFEAVVVRRNQIVGSHRAVEVRIFRSQSNMNRPKMPQAKANVATIGGVTVYLIWNCDYDDLKSNNRQSKFSSENVVRAMQRLTGAISQALTTIPRRSSRLVLTDSYIYGGTTKSGTYN